MIKVLFFAALREQLACEQLEWPYQPGMTLATLRSDLQQQGESWQQALARTDLMCARNQTLCANEQPLADGDEVAFFPPVTGG